MKEAEFGCDRDKLMGRTDFSRFPDRLKGSNHRNKLYKEIQGPLNVVAKIL